jgi:glycosyltransferase involved in cell wall biosynthesis
VSQPHLCLLGDANSVHLQRWAREMISRGFRVSVVTARAHDIAGVEQSVLSPVRRSVDWLRRVGEARRLVDQLAPDIVHAHYISSYGYLAARCDRHPLVMTAWGSDLLLTPRHSTLMRWLTGWTLRRADLITGDSFDLVEAAQAYRPKAAVHRIHWGADTAKFRPAPWAGKPAMGRQASIIMTPRRCNFATRTHHQNTQRCNFATRTHHQNPAEVQLCDTHPSA